jgi:hypothetical protein
MDWVIILIVGSLAIIPGILILIYYSCFMPKFYKIYEQTNDTRIQVYETNDMSTVQGSSLPASNTAYPEYSPPGEPSQATIYIPSNGPNSTSVQMPTISQETIYRPPAYGV